MTQLKWIFENGTRSHDRSFIFPYGEPTGLDNSLCRVTPSLLHGNGTVVENLTSLYVVCF